MRYTERKLPLFVMIVLLAFASFAAAQTPDADLLAEAEKEFAAASELLDKGTPEDLASAKPLFLSAAGKFAKAGNAEKRANSILYAARCADDLEEYDEALPLYTEAIKLYADLKNNEGVAVANNNIGNIYLARNDLEAARKYYEKALEIAARGEADSVVMNVYTSLIMIYEAAGDRPKALALSRDAIEASRRIGDIVGEARSINTLGQILSDLGDRASARTLFEKALDLAVENKIDDLEVLVLNNLGALHYHLGEQPKAREFYRQALARTDEKEEPEMTVLILTNLGQSHYAAGEVSQALEIYARGNTIAEKIISSVIVVTLENNIGLAYYWLKDNKQALTYFRKALERTRSIGVRSREATIMLNVAAVHQSEGRYEESVKTLAEVVELAEKTLDIPIIVTALNNLGMIALLENDVETAMTVLTRALPVSRDIGDRFIESKILNNLGRAYLMNGDNAKAVECLERSLVTAKAIGDRHGEAGALANLMYVWDDMKNPLYAVFYGKSSVNAYQQLREGISSLSPELQASYLASVSETYRKLADLLIRAGRIAEAEQVLVLLKQEELLDFVRRDDKMAGHLKGAVSLSPKEQEALARYSQLAENLTALGNEFSKLDMERKTFAVGEFPKQARYDELKRQLADANLVFEKFLEDLKIRFGQRDVRVAQVESGLRRTLERLKADRTAAVSTIVGKNELNIIVTTSRTQKAHRIEIAEEKINTLVATLRRALTSPQYDPRPASQELYNVLIKPIEGDLAGIKADTIVWSMDATLRYLPPAVLWDKQKGYLAERFSNVIVNLASRDTIALPVSDGKTWEVLGVGVSKAVDGFKPLTAVPVELECIVNDADAAHSANGKPQCDKGVLNGRRLLDEDFTLANFEDSIGRYPVIHIASHFQLEPGDDRNSFLLLGGGDQRRFTVEHLRNQSLADVELIVLSACNTATPAGGNANGIEIEGFGSVAQQEGAKAVMATLWAVFDTSTKDLMVEFYRLYGKGGITKAEALRQAQIKLMNGQYSAGEAGKVRSDIINFDGDGDEMPKFTPDPKAPFAHPYYWSPFILIGNWR